MIDCTSGKFHAVLSAYLSIIAGLVETFFSLVAGHEDISMSLYGIALMAVVDITGSALVLLVWQTNDIVVSLERTTKLKLKEAQYSYIIGALMMFLGLFLIADSAKTLIEGHSPHSKGEGGADVALFGTVSSAVLALYKYKVGHELDSSVITADAISTMCSALTSLVALVVVYNEKLYWWLDGSAGLMVAFYTLYSGAATMTSSSHQIGAFQCEIDAGGVHSPGYLKLMNKYRHSYQNDVNTPSTSRDRVHSKSGGGRPAGVIEIMNTRPTPYNFDNENRNQFSVFQLLYDQLNGNVFFRSTGANRQTTGSMAYDRIPATDDSEDEVFSA